MKETILSLLPGDFPWREQLLFFETVDSTNTLAKKLAAEGAKDGTVLIADAQTGGRGRMGRSFHSPSGTGIYLSVILRPGRPAQELMHLTCAAGVAMCDAVEAAVQLRPGIKWTNDLVCNGKKLGGILTELVLLPGADPCAIVGIGINCSQAAGDFPEDIRPIAASLSMACGHSVDRCSVIAAMLLSLKHMRDALFTEKSAIMQQYRKDCVTVGREISLRGGDSLRHGTAVGIDENGGLDVIFSDGSRQTVTSGEVSIRGMYGYV